MAKMPAERCFEIDEPVDFKIAEMLLRERKTAERLTSLPPEIELLILDFDGVMTDNTVVVNELGQESVRCHRGDGMGIAKLQASGVPVIVLSSEYNPVVTKRCEKLKISCIQRAENKVSILNQVLAERKVDPAKVVFVGNDINDLECLKAVGCGVAVKDAHEQIFNSAKLILEHNGGQGAVREICDLIMQKKGNKQ